MADIALIVDIDAPPERVWAVISDVERWPQWTESMTSVQRLEPGPLAVGSRAHVRQPRLLPATWQVTQIEPGRSFTWETRSPGLLMVATHAVEPRAGGSRITLAVESAGLLATLLRPLLMGTGRRYVEMEAAGLKREAERSADARNI
jgi:uncharacterized protein YndB with AHSA1/START domain